MLRKQPADLLTVFVDLGLQQLRLFGLTEAAAADIQAVARYTITTLGNRTGSPLRIDSRTPLPTHRMREGRNAGVFKVAS